MAQPKFCRDCAFVQPEKGSEWNLQCCNDFVVVKDSWTLSSSKAKGASCREERDKPWFIFPACGKAGKLYEKLT